MKGISRQLRFAVMAALTTLVLPLTSCGDTSGGETIWLYVVNGYTAANSVSIYGPTGPLAQGLAFGERVGPVEFDRRFGGDLQIVVEGTPGTVDLQANVFSMYPQETGTLFLKRRSGDSEVSMSIYRHVQTIDRDRCALTFENGLSTDNQYLTGGSFSFATEFNLDVDAAGYLVEENIPVTTECGPLPTPTRAPIPRTALRAAVEADPWFFYSDCQSEIFPSSVCPYWGQLDERDIVANPPTQEYFECVATAVSIKQPEGDSPSPFPPADAQVQCPPGELTWEDVQVDPNAVAECKARRRYPAELLDPSVGLESRTWTLWVGANGQDGNGNPTCDRTFRLRTPGLDVIFGPKDEGCTDVNCEGRHLNGGFVTTDLKVPGGSEHFYVLFGRPVNPLIWQWNSGQNFVNLAGYPYFNDQISRISEQDDQGSGNPAP